MCLHTTLRPNKKYTANIKNGGIVPPLPLLYDKKNDRITTDKRVLQVPTKCGKCIECMKQKAREWSVRMQEDIKDHKHAVMVTLTFSTPTIIELAKEIDPKIKGYARDNAIAKLAVKRWLERWRKATGKSVRHFLVTELGHKGTENIHLHGFVYTKDRSLINKTWNYKKNGYEYGGFTYPKKEDKNYVGAKAINYTVKYIHKQDEDHKYYKPIILCTTKPAIGAGYLTRHNAQTNRYKGNKTNELYTTETGKKISMPTYYRNKLYTEEERQELWQDKLDDPIKYIMGEKVDTTQGEVEFQKLLEYYRRKNEELGYGDGKIDIDERKRENERRNLKFMERILKGNKTQEDKYIEVLKLLNGQ